MSTPRSLLCPVDFSEHSRLALRWAAAFAQRFDGRVVVLSVVDPVLAEGARVRLGIDLATQETLPALNEFVDATWPSGRPASIAQVAVRTGEAAAKILEAAGSGGADLVVMGTQGLGGIRKWLLGSTTERVIRGAKQPVLAVPPSMHGDGADLRRLLVATDFSASADAAVRWAAGFAEEFKVALVLAHVVQPVAAAPQWRTYVEASVEEGHAAARTRLEERRATLNVEAEIVIASGHPAEEIASLAATHHADVIVMGLAHGDERQAPRPGTIAYRVLGTAGVPVLVVPDIR